MGAPPSQGLQAGLGCLVMKEAGGGVVCGQPRQVDRGQIMEDFGWHDKKLGLLL